MSICLNRRKYGKHISSYCFYVKYESTISRQNRLFFVDNIAFDRLLKYSIMACEGNPSYIEENISILLPNTEKLDTKDLFLKLGNTNI